MTDNYFEYDQAAAETVKGAMETGDFVKLPYDAVLFRWVRGEAGQAADAGSGVKHYGGWAAGEENMRDFAKTIPERFEPEMFTSPDGQKAYMNYCVRNLAVVPIGQRSCWKAIDPTSQARKHLQVICYASLFEQETKVYTPWMPVILSIKGLSATKLEDAFKAWKDATSTLRTLHANGAPANFFWCHIGTFTKARNVQTVGKQGAQNYITPPVAYVPEPEKLDLEWLKRCFVGKEMTVTLGQLAEESREWLDAWKKEEQEKPDSNKPASTGKATPPKKIDLGEPPF